MNDNVVSNKAAAPYVCNKPPFAEPTFFIFILMW